MPEIKQAGALLISVHINSAHFFQALNCELLAEESPHSQWRKKERKKERKNLMKNLILFSLCLDLSLSIFAGDLSEPGECCSFIVTTSFQLQAMTSSTA